MLRAHIERNFGRYLGLASYSGEMRMESHEGGCNGSISRDPSGSSALSCLPSNNSSFKVAWCFFAVNRSLKERPWHS
jgi:hypothetical protein